MKIGILTDSSCGIKSEEAKDLGIQVISIPFSIDDKEYFEDVNITTEDFFRKINSTSIIHTSQPSIETVTSKWDEMLKENDIIFYMPITSGLSSSCNTANILSEEDEYKGKVFVISCEKISITLRFALQDLKRMIELNYPPNKIKEIMEQNCKNSSIYIMVSDLTYLEKGGRLNPLFAKLGNILKIKPILFSSGGKFGVFEKARTLQKTKEIIMDAMESDMKNKFNDQDLSHFSVGVAHTQNEDEAQIFRLEMANRFKKTNTQIPVDELSLVVSCHIGPGSLAGAIYKNININRSE
ncbi:MAG: DegV family protein [Eubacteriales bacterium]|nr:DegV family protein [Eubacteriales bacterium]